MQSDTLVAYAWCEAQCLLSGTLSEIAQTHWQRGHTNRSWCAPASPEQRYAKAHRPTMLS